MIAIAYYLLKVIVCSGVLFFYYHLFLRNKLFHQWNRFYLLTAVILSILLPLVRFDLDESHALSSQEALNYLLVFQSTDRYLDEFVIEYRAGLSTEDWFAIAYCTVSVVLLIILALSIGKVIRILRRYSASRFANIKLLSTKEPGTPFSFFHYIIWNEEIPLQSATGQQIFQHELVHVQQKHTWDKLFMQTVLIVLWCNPFFWLIRKELRFIHEFIADQKAVGSDTAAFAAMILQSVYPKQFSTIVNPFFQSSIKRRLHMLTQVKNPRVAYLSRIVALPLVATIAFTICVRTNAQTTPKQKAQSSPSKIDSTFQHGKQVKNVDVIKDGNSVEIYYNDGTVETMSRQDANKKGIIIDDGYGNFSTPNGPLNKQATIRLNKTENPPLYIIDGKEATQQEVQALNPKDIESINVLKGDSAKAIYGDKGKNGVVEIKSKKQTDGSGETKPSGSSSFSQDSLGGEPIYLIDGKEVSKEQVSALNPNDIKMVDVYKGESAVSVFGEKGKNGVIKIELKKKSSNEPVTVIGHPLKKDNNGNTNDGGTSGQSSGEVVVKGYKKDRQSLDEVVVTGYPSKNDIVFEKAEFGASIDPGAWRKFLEDHSRPLIEEVAKTAPSGKYTVLVRFVVEKDGSLTGIQIVDDPGFGMGQKVAEMMKHAPKWKPAIQNEKVVRSYHTQPITFVIHNGATTTKNKGDVPAHEKTIRDLLKAQENDVVLSFTVTKAGSNGMAERLQLEGENELPAVRKFLSTVPDGDSFTIQSIVASRNGVKTKLPAIVHKR